MGLSIIVVVIIMLMYYLDILSLKTRDESYAIAIWLFGWPDIVSDDLTLWDRDNVKLTMESSLEANSMPVRLYVQLDPIDDDNVAITNKVVSRRLALMSSDTVSYNFANFQFSIKDKTLIDALKKALLLRRMSQGAPSSFENNERWRIVLDFKSAFVR